jgi:hypothetical protein
MISPTFFRLAAILEQLPSFRGDWGRFVRWAFWRACTKFFVRLGVEAMKTTFGVLFAIAFILGLASVVVGDSQLRIDLQVQSAPNWQYAARVAAVSTQVFDRSLSGTGQL